jgi:aminoglycoside/choline kinase family phosphotransferase
VEESKRISELYREYAGRSPEDVVPLPQSGSDRKYFRINDSNKKIIAAFNTNREENEAFVGFTKHFRSVSLPVPEVFHFFREDNIYFLQDLGDTNLFTYLRKKTLGTKFDDGTLALYRKVLKILVNFQTRGISGLNLDLCYPHKSFDKQSMMWDMNYFKYMFLKLLVVPFNEKRLEYDFNEMADFLLGEDQEYFLYRDFQSANIMVVREEPWFIDYQGGRKGAPQYDVASLLYDAKAGIPENVRRQLFDYYVDIFCTLTGGSRKEFLGYYTGYSMIRLMQALGAFGFRGLYEKKPTFADSIVPAVRLLLQLIDADDLPVNLPEVRQSIYAISSTNIYKSLSRKFDFQKE